MSNRHLRFCILSCKMGEKTSARLQSTTVDSVSETIIDPMFRVGCVCEREREKLVRIRNGSIGNCKENF